MRLPAAMKCAAYYFRWRVRGRRPAILAAPIFGDVGPRGFGIAALGTWGARCRRWGRGGGPWRLCAALPWGCGGAWPSLAIYVTRVCGGRVGDGGAWRYRQFGTRSDSRRTRWGGVKSHAMPPAFAGVTCLFRRPKIRTCAGKKTIIIERISGIFGFQVQYMHAKFLALECLYLTVRQSKNSLRGCVVLNLRFYSKTRAAPHLTMSGA